MELEKLKKIICRELTNIKEEDITEDTRFVEDLNADSLDVVQIVMGIEDEFGIEIPEEASYQIKTVGEAHKAILKALIHPSYSNEMGEAKEASNQRLEFLGDAVLELISSTVLYHRKPAMQEGLMTKLRAALVCEPALAAVAKALKLSEHIVLGKGEGREGIQYRDSVLSDTLEAIIGAIYLDSGIESASCFVKKNLLNDIEKKQLQMDAKTMLQEYSTAKHLPLHYSLLEESGPFHDRFYRVMVYLGDTEYGMGEGSSKKKAEQNAAYFALEKIKAETGDVFKIY